MIGSATKEYNPYATDFFQFVLILLFIIVILYATIDYRDAVKLNWNSLIERADSFRQLKNFLRIIKPTAPT
jgi:hypothetical protein